MSRVQRPARLDEVWVGLTAPVTRVHWPATNGPQLDLPGRVERYSITTYQEDG